MLCMNTKTMEHYVFRYNGEASSEETVRDFDGEYADLKEGDVIKHKGKNWTVQVIQKTEFLNSALPVVRLDLTQL